MLNTKEFLIPFSPNKIVHNLILFRKRKVQSTENLERFVKLNTRKKLWFSSFNDLFTLLIYLATVPHKLTI